MTRGFCVRSASTFQTPVTMMVQASIASDYNCNSAKWLTACGKKQSTARTVKDRRSALNDTITGIPFAPQITIALGNSAKLPKPNAGNLNCVLRTFAKEPPSNDSRQGASPANLANGANAGKRKDEGATVSVAG
jgi:hypothetical protein